MLRCIYCRRPLRKLRRNHLLIGDECLTKANRDRAAVKSAAPSLLTFGLFCQRLRDGRKVINVKHLIRHHARELDWGYGGAGPADLALNVLHHLIPAKPGDDMRVGGIIVSEQAWRMYQAFKWRFIQPIPDEGGSVPIANMTRWIKEQQSSMAVMD